MNEKRVNKLIEKHVRENLTENRKGLDWFEIPTRVWKFASTDSVVELIERLNYLEKFLGIVFQNKTETKTTKGYVKAKK